MGQLFGETPAWVVDGKNYLGFFASFVAAMALVWKYAIKPYLEHRELERKRDMLAAADLRKGEIRAAVLPMEEQMRAMQTEVKRYTDKLLLQGDAIHGINLQLAELARGQQMLHAEVRAHMEVEDARERNKGSHQ